MRLPTLALILISIPIGMMNSFGATYFLSPNGSDSNSGTATNAPWKTIAKVNSLSLKPGDKVLFEGGKIFSGNLVLDASDGGSSTNAVVIGSYGSGRAVIKAGLGNGLFASNCAGVVIEHLYFSGLGSTTNKGSGIMFFTDYTGGKKLDYVRLSYVDAYGFGKEGIAFKTFDPQKSGYRDVLVDNVKCHDNLLAGMRTYCYYTTNSADWSYQNFTVRNSKFYNNSGDPNKTDNQSGNGLLLVDVKNGLIDSCVAYNNGSFCNFKNAGPGGIWICDCNGVVIQFCESHHNRTGSNSVDGGGFDFDSAVVNSTMQYNYSHDNTGGGFLFCHSADMRAWSNNVVRYNISQNDARHRSHGGLQAYNIGPALLDSHFINNTVYMDPGSDILSNGVVLITGPVSNLTFRNNIFISTNGTTMIKAKSTKGVTFQGNEYWTSGGPMKITWGSTNFTSLSSWISSKGQEKLNGSIVAINSDPMLVAPGAGGTFDNAKNLKLLSAYRLNSNSTLINKAIDVKNVFGINPGARDFYGNVVPLSGVADVGANECR